MTTISEGAGWAPATIRYEQGKIEAAASYFGAPLADLANAAIRLSMGAPEATVAFMDEPGEHQLVLTRNDGDAVIFEVWWIDQTLGPEQWVQSEFPTAEYNRLWAI